MKVLITVPYMYGTGGVINFYEAVLKHFSSPHRIFEMGARKAQENGFEKLSHLGGDWLRFNRLCKDIGSDFDLVIVNPSFLKYALIRDGGFLRRAAKTDKPIIVFFHGWDKRYEGLVDRFFKKTFFKTYNRAAAFVVLSSEFKNKLRQWGFKQPIYMGVTPVDNDLTSGFSLADRLAHIDQEGIKTILFLSRLEKTKGICEATEAFDILHKKNPGLRLLVAGDGDFFEEARRFAAGFQGDIRFLGYVRGEDKKQVFKEADLYLFPSYYGEGMPTSVLEAMAFGLPVITRKVGGLTDLLQDGTHGFLTDSKAPADFARMMQTIIDDRNLYKNMSANCHAYARENFLASKVAGRLEQICMEVAAVGTVGRP